MHPDCLALGPVEGSWGFFFADLTSHPWEGRSVILYRQ